MPAGNGDDSLLALGKELSARYPAPEVQYGPGLRLIGEGVRNEQVYLLTSGTVKLSFVDQCGREFIVSLRSATRLIGAESALMEVPSLYSATTLSHCCARQFRAADIRNSLRNVPEMSFHMNRLLSRENLEQTTALMELFSGTARLRLINLLKRLDIREVDAQADRAGPAGPILKKHELAKLLAVTPEHLSRLLRVLKREGLIRSAAGRGSTQGPSDSDSDYEVNGRAY